MSPGQLHPASTVVLLRPSDRAFEVFLVRRHDRIAFMGGAHVFPGGRVDRGDFTADADAWCDGVGGAIARLAARPPEEAVAFYVAALRELFEEAGVLLAREVSGEIVTIADAARPRFDAYRRDLAAGRMTLRDLAARERLRPALDALAPFAHWVTPDVETRRFDTHFFLAVAPPGQVAAHDDSESTDGVWLPPADATARCLNGELALPPPTWTTLRALSGFDRVEDARAWALEQRAPRIQPRVTALADGSREILLPGHPTFPAIDGFEPRETRFLLENGRWMPADYRGGTSGSARPGR